MSAGEHPASTLTPEQAAALRRNAAGYGQGAAHYAARGHPVLAGEQARIAAHCAIRVLDLYATHEEAQATEERLRQPAE